MPSNGYVLYVQQLSYGYQKKIENKLLAIFFHSIQFPNGRRQLGRSLCIDILINNTVCSEEHRSCWILIIHVESIWKEIQDKSS
ncbi:hypothetical protein CUMW_166900 [Citrus unshiu]|uniref:Uncharacterized protein n=1 Tax=Citrus unshiu TaxID=55188 RepID=A0A2H5PTY4_CITUN|nr:hypothetical protein CUMW_166900 [Citrus unshiu]